MSLKTFIPANIINGNTGVAGTAAYGEYVLRLAVRRQGNGRIITKDVTFGLGSNAAAPIADMDEAAVKMSEKIAALSDGVILGMYKKLGKYRNDELPEAVHDLKSQWASIIMGNDPRQDDPNAAGPYPKRTVTTKVFIPWINEFISRQDLVSTLKTPITVGANSFSFSTSRFSDVDKTTIEAYVCQHNAGVTVKEYQRMKNFELLNDDTESGSADGVISGAMGVVVQGTDD